MPKSDPTRSDHPLRETEQAAYHAYREWPVLILLRLRELAARRMPTPFITPTATDKPAPDPKGER